jgi:hypothetical protein
MPQSTSLRHLWRYRCGGGKLQILVRQWDDYSWTPNRGRADNEVCAFTSLVDLVAHSSVFRALSVQKVVIENFRENRNVLRICGARERELFSHQAFAISKLLKNNAPEMTKTRIYLILYGGMGMSLIAASVLRLSVAQNHLRLGTLDRTERATHGHRALIY